MIRNILEHLENSAARLPDKIAFYDDVQKLTYSQLLHVSKAVGSALAQVAAPRNPVAMLMDARSITNIPSIWGIIYAGCAYAPLDITMPGERLQQLLEKFLAAEGGHCGPPRMDGQMEDGWMSG